MNITIFTDGSSRGNPGRGGWGAIVAGEDMVSELGGGDLHTTNNRMELTAVIESLKLVAKLTNDNPKLPTTIHTDSSYVLNGATKWLSGWIRNNWKTKAKGEVLNQDLWQELANVLTKVNGLTWVLVKGHSGVLANERCDEIATSFADYGKADLYRGLRSGYAINLSTPPKIKSNPPKVKKSKNSVPAYSYVSMVNGEIGIHTTWKECERRVKGVSGARFKKSQNSEDEKNIISQWKKG